MSNFDKAFTHLLGVEGKFVNNSADRGGPTNFGITQKVYEAFLGRKVTVDEIKKMPVDHAKQIYKKSYWDKVGGDLLTSYKIAYLLFDQGVNRGVPTAIIQAQRLLGILTDGSMGATTVRAINQANEKTFIDSYLAGAEAAYRAIASKDNTQDVFLKGWLNRVSNLRSYLNGVQGAVIISGGVLLFTGILIFFLIQGFGSRTARMA